MPDETKDPSHQAKTIQAQFGRAVYRHMAENYACILETWRYGYNVDKRFMNATSS